MTKIDDGIGEPSEMLRILLTNWKDKLWRWAWLILLILGLLVFLGGHVAGPGELQAGLFKAGEIVCISSVSMMVLKSFQFSGVFRSVFLDVITDPDAFRTLANPERRWKDMTTALYQNKFPDIADKISQTIRSKYLPDNHDWYYKNLRMVYVVTWHDEARGLIRLEQTRIFEMVPNDKESTVKFRFTYVANDRLETVAGPGLPTVSEFSVDGVTRVVTPRTGNKADEVTFEHEEELVGQTRYAVALKTVRIFSLADDPILSMYTSRIIDKVQVRVSCLAEGLRTYFLTAGVHEDFEDVRDPAERSARPADINQQFDGLIFPNQGYVIFLGRMAASG